jgi:hypothetical protein
VCCCIFDTMPMETYATSLAPAEDVNAVVTEANNNNSKGDSKGEAVEDVTNCR